MASISKVDELVQEIKRMWASSLAKLDNTSGRRGFAMQLEAVEEMCATRIDRMVFAATQGLQVVTDPRQLKKKRPAGGAPRQARLVDLPLGTRFSYLAFPDDTFVLLDAYGRDGHGLVARWEGVDGPTTGQTVCSIDDTPEKVKALVVLVRD